MEKNTKPSDRQFEPVADGALTKSRKGVFRFIFDEVIVKNYEELKSNFVEEVVVPNTLDWLYGILSNMVNDMFKSPGSRGSTLPKSYQSRKSYDKYYRGSRLSGRNDRSDRDEEYDDNPINYYDISFKTRAEAEKVISYMRSTLKDYDGLVTIADLCSFSNVQSTWADNTYGWTNLDNARVIRHNGRFYLDLPNPLPINKD